MVCRACPKKGRKSISKEDRCNEEKAELLLIAGDLFHRQPLLRELKEANSLFEALKNTQVVLIAGNHDHLKRDSFYRTFEWAENVHMILSGELACVELPGLSAAVYGLSYHAKETAERRYDGAAGRSGRSHCGRN